jgi:hypothetical protein
VSKEKSSLLMVLVVGWFAGHALATPFTLDKYDALSFHQVGVSSSDFGVLAGVTDDASTYTYSGGPMQGAVGYVGRLWDLGDPDYLASMQIGTGGLSLAGYDGFTADLANDDNSTWSVQLYLVDGSGLQTSGLVPLNPGVMTSLSVASTAGPITEIGFYVLGTFDFPADPLAPSNPDWFHVSVVPATTSIPVPVPGAGLLSLLGVGIVGLVRRCRHV